MARVFPVHSRCWRVSQLLRDEHPAERAQRASRRLLELVPGLDAGSLLTLVLAGDGSGQVQIEIHSDTDSKLQSSDVEWVFEKVAVVEPIAERPNQMPEMGELTLLYELLGVTEEPSLRYGGVPLVEASTLTELSQRANPRYWPVGVLTDCMDLLSALTACRAQVRVHLAPANDVESSHIGAQLRDSAQLGGAVNNQLYMGSPVRIHCFVGTSEQRLSPRLRAALLNMGVGLRLRQLPLTEEAIATWQGEETSLAGAAQPFGKALCLVPIPASGLQVSICGVQTREAQLDTVPLTGFDPPADGLRLGRATDELGQTHEVRLGVNDLLLHTQVLGATGTGKSSLLAGLVQDAIRAGIGVTVLDAHGPLVERILRELPRDDIDRTIAVLSDDADNRVPVNVLANEDADLTLDAMLQVLGDIFDPQAQGIVGPRFERITSQIIKAQQALIGSCANFATIPMWLRDRRTVTRLADALRYLDADLASSIGSELAGNQSNEFSEVLAWVNSKFQRLTNTAELRAILLSGKDAINVTDVVDRQQVLLINLAANEIGSLGARFLGEMWLLKHWLAMSQRRDVAQPHLVIVDEAQLFGAGILPRMLAEARKFGFGIVMAHQHLEQLSVQLREAALANTNNVIVFRSGPMEAATAMLRLGSWPSGPLTRLARLTAAATLSTDARQTEPFTLIVDHNERVQPDEEDTTDTVLQNTQSQFVDPYRTVEQWTHTRVDDVLAQCAPARPDRDEPPPFLDKWLAKRDEAKARMQAETETAEEADTSSPRSGDAVPGLVADPQDDTLGLLEPPEDPR